MRIIDTYSYAAAHSVCLQKKREGEGSLTHTRPCFVRVLVQISLRAVFRNSELAGNKHVVLVVRNVLDGDATQDNHFLRGFAMRIWPVSMAFQHTRFYFSRDFDNCGNLPIKPTPESEKTQSGTQIGWKRVGRTETQLAGSCNQSAVCWLATTARSLCDVGAHNLCQCQNTRCGYIHFLARSSARNLQWTMGQGLATTGCYVGSGWAQRRKYIVVTTFELAEKCFVQYIGHHQTHAIVVACPR